MMRLYDIHVDNIALPTKTGQMYSLALPENDFPFTGPLTTDELQNTKSFDLST